MDPTPLELLEVEVKFQAKQIEVLTNAVKFLETKLPAFCQRCKMPLPPPAFGSRNDRG